MRNAGPATRVTGVEHARAPVVRINDGAARWESLCLAADDMTEHPWPADAAQSLFDAVDTWMASGDESDLERAARVWAATAPMPVVVRRLGSLREVFIGSGEATTAGERERLQSALDVVTTVATEAALAELQEAALTDALTDLGNRRAMESAGLAAVASARRSGNGLSVAVIDLDGLKAINDTDGHAAGDKALAGISASLRAALRETDQLFRIGGDEFVAVLPMADQSDVADLMKRAERFNAPRFSWGAASVPEDGTELLELLETADARLYEARQHSGYYEQRSHRPTRETADEISSGAAPARRRWSWAQLLVPVVAVVSVTIVAVAYGNASNDKVPPPTVGHQSNGASSTTAGSGTSPSNNSTGGSSSPNTNGGSAGTRTATSTGPGATATSSSGASSGGNPSGSGSSSVSTTTTAPFQIVLQPPPTSTNQLSTTTSPPLG